MPAPDSPPSSLSFRKSRTVLYASVALLVLLVGLAALGAVWQLHQEAERRTATTTERLARSMELSLDGLIDSIDVALLAAGDEISRQLAVGRPDGRSINRLLGRQEARLPQGFLPARHRRAR